MNVTHHPLMLFAGAILVPVLLGTCFLIGFAVTCGAWRADGFMAAREEKREREREARNALRTVDEDYARLCEDPDQE